MTRLIDKLVYTPAIILFILFAVVWKISHLLRPSAEYKAWHWSGVGVEIKGKE